MSILVLKRQKMLVPSGCIPSAWCVESAVLSVQHQDVILVFRN